MLATTMLLGHSEVGMHRNHTDESFPEAVNDIQRIKMRFNWVSAKAKRRRFKVCLECAGNPPSRSGFRAAR
jgi:hypothetical protein